ncbi:hypothetical protein [Sphingomonas bacterium]|uniref:hypothetical protein n=1 Tax=Sphingomonas bacterium TaxID=1895847 RepID=UPI00261EC631|nr:hypothetical protein [Sphingomonas bacterium]MDB5679153.1 hypothetical protein [Sphingomonas bacterium]
MRIARRILFGIIILAAPVAIFCLLGVLPFAYTSWLGGGIAQIVAVMAIPGIVCIAALKVPRWQRVIAAALYLMLYAPACLFPGFLATCILVVCHA